jgi:glycosyltransferase involved in cell wall biosynthesis
MVPEPAMSVTSDRSRPLQVLHMVQNLNYGGMERLIADLARRADPARFSSHVLALQYVGRFGHELDGVAAVHLGPKQEPWSLLRPARLASLIREIGPDVVNTHSGVWYKGSLAARMAGVPRIVHTEHGRRVPESWLDRLNDRIAARRTDTVVAVSDALVDYMRARVLPRGTDLRLVRNGVDTTAYRPRPADPTLPAELDLAADRPVIGSIGRFEPVKGYDIMIDAFATLLEAWTLAPLPALVVVGDGSQRAELERIARLRGIADHVRLTGWRDDVKRLHGLFSIFTMSSRSEGTSVSLLEAMSAGLCPVVTDVGGNAAVLGPALAHRLVPAEDPAALAAAWGRVLIDEPDRRLADARLARHRVEQSFELDGMVRGYEAIYAGESDAVQAGSMTSSST